MISYLLGAPGSGKTVIGPRLRVLLPGHVIMDWDALMGPAGELAKAPIPQTPDTWPAYGRLVRAVADMIMPRDLMVLGVCTPDELADWPDGPWVLLDCSDEVRRRRLQQRNEPDDVADALADAAHYRTLGLPRVDASELTPEATAVAVLDTLTEASRPFSTNR